MLAGPVVVIGVVTTIVTIVRHTVEPYKRFRRAKQTGVRQVQPLMVADYSELLDALPPEHRSKVERQAERGAFVMYGGTA